MQIYRQLADLPAAHTPVVATIGNFDGVHLGHQSILAEVIAHARALSGLSLAITFEPHPARVLRPNQPLPLITPLPRKLELLAATGIDATLVLPFTDALRQMSARDFATRVLVQAVCVSEVHEGENFRFGHHADSGVNVAATGGESLEAFGRELGFTVRVHAPCSLRGAPVSSSRIRALIAAGDVSQTRALLGRPFDLDSTPASGRGYGTRYAVPTINLAPYAELLPANGVYITTLTVVNDELAESYQAVTNLGNRPTFGPDSFAVESHLLDFHPLEGPQALTEQTPLRLTFLRRLRPERRFDTPESLLAQISRDVAQARRYFTLYRALDQSVSSVS
jgi:riboflavin kinase/FMN adenylyltransferase